MDYHDIGVSVCNTVDKCCPTTLTEEQRTALIGAVAVWLDKQHKKGREAGMREAIALYDGLTKGYYDHAISPYKHYRDAILSAIEGAK